MYYTVGSRPLAGVSKKRSVYLPAGCAWYNFWTDERLAGGQTVSADAPLDILPLYVRSGSIVPMGPLRQYADEQPDAIVELHIYPGQDGEFELYEDEGDGYNYEQGAFATVPIRWQEAAGRLVLDARAGRYPGMREEREFLAVLHGQGPAGQAQDEHSRSRLVTYKGQPVVIQF